MDTAAPGSDRHRRRRSGRDGDGTGRHPSGFLSVTIFERYPEVRPAGNILNLWPPPQKVLGLLGVDIDDLGAPTDSEFRRADGRVRARVRLPRTSRTSTAAVSSVCYGRASTSGCSSPAGGHDSLRPRPDILHRHRTEVMVHLATRRDRRGVLVGADGINSSCAGPWGDHPIRHQKLHLVAGYLFCDAPEPVTIVAHNRQTQGSYSAIRHEGQSGYEWWVLEAFDPSVPFPETCGGR